MTEWIKCIVGYLLIVSVVVQMLTNAKYEQYVKLFACFLLIIIVIRPVLKIGSADSFLEQKISEFLQAQEKLEDQIGMQREAFEQEAQKIQEADTETIIIREIEEIQVEVTSDD